MKNLIVVLFVLFLIVGCASTDPLIKREVRDVTHFITFRSDPIGADVLVVNSINGKEVGIFGKTPVRILVLRKTVEVSKLLDGRSQVRLMKLDAAGFAVTYGGKIEDLKKDVALQADGAEFQFKFKMPGYYDEIKLERIPFQTSSDTDTTINMTLKQVK